MKNTLQLTLAFLLLIIHVGNAQSVTSELYSAAYGANSNPAIVFVHGGPGYNSYSFEQSTAQRLADEGYYVIVFDQRGCGRSKEVSGSDYTFEEAFSDINGIFEKYDIEQATLIGHSWGGTLSAKFAVIYPKKVQNIVLTDAPVSYQRTFKTIIKKCRAIYSEKDTTQLKYIEMLEDMDSNSIAYSSYCFMHAMNCGFYKPEQPTKQAKRIYKQLGQSDQAHLLSDMTREPVSGFHKNEQYTLINLSESINRLNDTINVFGIYGVEDGLFDTQEFNRIRELIGEEHFILVQNASHSVFIDQQDQFIEAVNAFIGDQ